MIRWTRTFEGRQFDFVAELDGRKIGRIYRHTDKIRWQYFAWLADRTGKNGVCDNRQDAIAEIERLAVER